MRSTTDLAWAAGIFEGEGSVRIDRPGPRNRGALLCDMVNTLPEVTAFFADQWGGRRRLVVMDPPRQDYYRWRIAALQAAAFLRDIQPYLRTAKYRERVTLGLAFQAQKLATRANREPAYIASQTDYYERMRTLNVRGR